MEKPFLSIIIPNYNGEALLRRYLPSVVRAVENATFSSEIIVSDDASSDSSLEVLANFPTVKVIRREVNGGFSEATNTGMRAAQGTIFLFLNTDVELESDFLHHFQHYFKDDQVFAVSASGFDMKTGRPMDGGKIGFWQWGKPRTTKNYYEEHARSRNIPKPYPSFSVSGAFFFCDGNKARQLGGFDTLYSPFIFEDIDFTYRALKRGWKNYWEPRLRARHDHSSTLKKVARPLRIKIISKRNQIIFILLNIHSPRLMASFLFFLLLRLLLLMPVHWAALYRILPLLPRIMRRRAEERAAAVVSDLELFRAYDFR